MSNDFTDFFSMFDTDPKITMRQYELNRLYKEDIQKYSKKLVETKWEGYRVFRNKNGEHLLKVRK